MNDVLKSHIIELDSLTVRLFRLLRDLNAVEPQQPSGDMPRHLAEEMATDHYEWSRQRDGARILLGLQLVNLGLEQLEHPMEGTE